LDKQIRVVPAILTDDPKALKTMVHQAESFTDYVQFDIMDEQFVPSQSITYKHLAALTTKLKWEAHLMIKHPEDYLEGFQQAGAKKLIFHYEATRSPREVIAQVKSLGMEVGLAINPDTPISKITPLTSEVDSVLFLSVYPGFYGKKLIPEVLDKVADFRNVYPEVEIGIDGGIKESNITRVVRAGVNVIYIGSAIFHQEHPGESYRRLMELAREGLSTEDNK
jgi:ribulose-phosphate 3-epimerase